MNTQFKFYLRCLGGINEELILDNEYLGYTSDEWLQLTIDEQSSILNEYLLDWTSSYIQLEWDYYHE